MIRKWLCVWTSETKGIPVDHGIPQGPIASDFLAEIFLLPLDEAMDKAGIPYIRYVDDIRVLAKTEDEVRRASVVLEMECRRWSLIPQGSKFKVTYAKDVTEALGTLPSIAESTGRDPRVDAYKFLPETNMQQDALWELQTGHTSVQETSQLAPQKQEGRVLWPEMATDDLNRHAKPL